MNKTLLKREIKANWILYAILTGVLVMYAVMCTSLYNPDTYKLFKSMRETMPQAMDAMGMSFDDESLVGFLNSYLFGFLYIMIPIIYEVILANRLIVRYVDNGSMAFLLATPNKRSVIARNQAVFLSISIILMVFITLGAGMIASAAMWPGKLNTNSFVIMHIGLLGLHMFISGFCFFCSCQFNEMKTSYGVGAGVTIAFYVIQMIANIGDKFENLRYITFYTLFSTKDIMNRTDGYVRNMIILYLAGACFYIAGIHRFQKKNMML